MPPFFGVFWVSTFLFLFVSVTLLGVWTCVSPWAVAGSVHTTRTIWSNCVAGGVAVLLGLMVVSMAGMGVAGMSRGSRGRGMPSV